MNAKWQNCYTTFDPVATSVEMKFQPFSGPLQVVHQESIFTLDDVYVPSVIVFPGLPLVSSGVRVSP